MAQRDILDPDPGRARAFDAVFIALSNDALRSPRKVISHLLPILPVANAGCERCVALFITAGPSTKLCVGVAR
jgi:hypothetical protein